MVLMESCRTSVARAQASSVTRAQAFIASCRTSVARAQALRQILLQVTGY